MNRTRRAFVALVLGFGVLAMVGCTGRMTSQADSTKVWGYVSAPDKAQLELSDSQLGVDQLSISRVLSPADGWIVVNADVNGQPGARVGLVQVKRGESVNLKVGITNLTTPKVIVALQADKGIPGTFEFDMINKEVSPDRPFFVNGAELAKVVTVREYGVQVSKGAASLEASAQPGATGEIVISRVTAPSDAWVVVSPEKSGGPGQRIGLVHVPSGVTSDVVVPLEPVKLTPDLIVVLHADKGDPGLFEYDLEDKLNSKDQPFVMGGQEVSTKVRVQ